MWFRFHLDWSAVGGAFASLYWFNHWFAVVALVIKKKIRLANRRKNFVENFQQTTVAANRYEPAYIFHFCYHNRGGTAKPVQTGILTKTKVFVRKIWRQWLCGWQVSFFWLLIAVLIIRCKLADSFVYVTLGGLRTFLITHTPKIMSSLTYYGRPVFTIPQLCLTEQSAYHRW